MGVTFREENGKVYVNEDWPQITEFENSVLEANVDYLIVDGSVITIHVENGFASYMKRHRKENCWICEKGESEFIE